MMSGVLFGMDEGGGGRTPPEETTSASFSAGTAGGNGNGGGLGGGEDGDGGGNVVVFGGGPKSVAYSDYSLLPRDVEDDKARAVGVAVSIVDPRDGMRNESFPCKLHRILSEAESGGFADCITWLPHGRSFRILSTGELEERVLPVYFNSSRIASFMRQVNGWGFRRVGNGPSVGSYYHELCLRGLPHLARRINKPKGGLPRKNKKEMSSVAAPNFEAISRERPLPSGESKDDLKPQAGVASEAMVNASPARVSSLVASSLAQGGEHTSPASSGGGVNANNANAVLAKLEQLQAQQQQPERLKQPPQQLPPAAQQPQILSLLQGLIDQEQLHQTQQQSQTQNAAQQQALQTLQQQIQNGQQAQQLLQTLQQQIQNGQQAQQLLQTLQQQIQNGQQAQQLLQTLQQQIQDGQQAQQLLQTLQQQAQNGQQARQLLQTLQQQAQNGQQAQQLLQSLQQQTHNGQHAQQLLHRQLQAPPEKLLHLLRVTQGHQQQPLLQPNSTMVASPNLAVGLEGLPALRASSNDGTGLVGTNSPSTLTTAASLVQQAPNVAVVALPATAQRAASSSASGGGVPLLQFLGHVPQPQQQQQQPPLAGVGLQAIATANRMSLLGSVGGQQGEAQLATTGGASDLARAVLSLSGEVQQAPSL